MKTAAKYTPLLLALILLILLLGFALDFYQESKFSEDPIGFLRSFAAWFLGGIGLTTLGVMVTQLLVGIRRRDPRRVVYQWIGGSGLISAVFSTLFWIILMVSMSLWPKIGALTVRFFFSPVGFLMLIAVQVLLILRISKSILMPFFIDEPKKEG